MAMAMAAAYAEPLLSCPRLRPLPPALFASIALRFLSSNVHCHSRPKKNKRREATRSHGDVSRSDMDQDGLSRSLLRVRRRTRSELEVDHSQWENYFPLDPNSNSDHLHRPHIPVMLGEVLNVFETLQIRSFVDCTLGAAGHSTALIRSHPEMRVLLGLDMDPMALDLSRSRIEQLRCAEGLPDLRVHTRLTNFKHVKAVVSEVDDLISVGAVDGILMDLGMSSMQVDNSERGFSILVDGPLDMRMNPQASLTAHDILNSWPEVEVGRIICEYGEENNWRLLQRKIVNARTNGGLHSTTDLANLIRTMPLNSKGRHGWIKTASRVFQALRIAVNDELKTLEGALYACFDCLSPGGRLAVISFHSLEDRIVKHTFLDIVGKTNVDGEGKEIYKSKEDPIVVQEEWSKGRVAGAKGIILTKRPITPSVQEEKLNPRCRSAKLRVLQKF